MRENMKKKMNNQKGFTLAELLIVVAIIAILTMVSVPVFTGKLEEARVQTDKANMRSAKAAAVAAYLDKQVKITGQYYDADKGILVDTAGKPTTGYGQTKKPHTTEFGTGDQAHENRILKVEVEDNGEVTLNWVDVGSGS